MGCPSFVFETIVLVNNILCVQIIKLSSANKMMDKPKRYNRPTIYDPKVHAISRYLNENWNEPFWGSQVTLHPITLSEDFSNTRSDRVGNLCSIDNMELYTARKFKVRELEDFAGCLKSVWCSVIGDFRLIFVKWVNYQFVKIHFSLTQKTYLLLIIRHDRLRRLANMSFRWHRANIWTFCLQSIVICKQFFSALSPYMTLNKTFQFHLFHRYLGTLWPKIYYMSYSL